MRLSVGIFVLAVVACADGDRLFLPSGDGAAAVVVFVDSQGQAQLAVAADEGEIFVLRDAVTEVDGRFFRIEYSRSLEVLELPSGRLPLDVSGERLLDLDGEISVAVLTEGSLGELQPLSSPPPELGRVRLRLPKNPCRRLASTRIDLPSNYSPRIAFPLDEDSILVGLKGGLFFRVSKDGATPLTDLSTTTPDLAGYRAPDGEIWLAGGGRLVHGTLETGFVESEPFGLDDLDARMELVGPNTPDAPFELYLWTEEGVLRRFDGSQWTEIGTLPIAEGERADWPRAIWLGPSEVMALHSQSSEILHVEGEQLTFDRTFTEQGWVPRAFGLVESFGLVVGTLHGELSIRTDFGFDFLLDGPNARILVIDEIEDGLIYGGDAGGLIQYYPPDTFCPAEVFATRSFGHIIPQRKGYWMIPWFDNEAGQALFYVEPL